MDIHENARTTPRSRMLIVERLEAGSTVAAVASAFGVDGRTVRKWRDRFRVEGAAGLGDRSSRPHSCPFRLDAAAETEIAVLRRQRLSGPAIARRLGRPISTVGKALRRIGLGRLKALDTAVAVVRYEREQPGELIHIDSKKLGGIDGIGHRITGDRRGQSSRRGRGEGLGWEALLQGGEVLLGQMPETGLVNADKGMTATPSAARSASGQPQHPAQGQSHLENRFSPFLYRDRNAIERISSAARSTGVSHCTRSPMRQSRSAPDESDGWTVQKELPIVPARLLEEGTGMAQKELA